jgi:hypothetical protein
VHYGRNFRYRNGRKNLGLAVIRRKSVVERNDIGVPSIIGKLAPMQIKPKTILLRLFEKMVKINLLFLK